MAEFILDTERVRTTVDNYKRVKSQVEEAAIRANRQVSDVRLMCVTKTVEPQYINPVLDLGADLIGENRVQEYLGKKDALHLDGVERHLIGHLQTNKVRQIVGEVDMIESVDSFRLANEISKQSQKIGTATNVLVEVNVGKEESKSGIYIEELEDLLYSISQLDGVSVKGLMTIPPICDEKEVRKYFERLHRAFVDIKDKRIDNISMELLSMGMSGDYEAAVLEGSNIVRVGSAIFGARKYF
ncbi:MAG: YggS family pyridoxal phosphate-dependent enzyme [Ruminococcaceae bacterium]|nr:YggS family pyridoxal phosphate-dependent enzyme [Oscillospiraceae bacterium]